MTAPEPAPTRLLEDPAPYRAEPTALAEAELTALWLLGRVPPDLLPWRLLRAGRAGRGPGPDVREAAFLSQQGVPIGGDIEVHLRASDFIHHGHADDPAYNRVVLHLVWEDDRIETGTPTRLPNGRTVPTIAVAPALDSDPRRLRRLVRRGPMGSEPCAAAARAGHTPALIERIRTEGQRRTAERAWRAARLVELRGWDGAWSELLIRSLRGSAGRRAESAEAREDLAAAITHALVAGPADGGGSIARALRALAINGQPTTLIQGLRRSGRPGRARAAEIGWNAALPLLAAGAAAYGDRALAAAVASLVERWPAPRPYGRTAALRQLLECAVPAAGDAPSAPRGALYAQGLLHVQDLWCERGGCGVCPCSLERADHADAEPR